MRSALLALLLFIGVFCSAQNLVPNGSFEDYSLCPTSFDQISYANGWVGFSTEYFNSCSQQGWQLFGVPTNDMGYQYAATGNAYGGLFTYGGTDNYREHIGILLSTPLVVGVRYFASIKVCLSDYSDCSTNNIGLSFTTYPYDETKSLPILNHAIVYSSNVIEDSVSWIRISGSFVADSAYQYVTIGNFFGDSLTNRISIATGCNAYYFVDDVCVSVDSSECILNTHTSTLQVWEDIVVSPNPSNHQIKVSVSNLEALHFDLLNNQGEPVIEKSDNQPVIDVSQVSPGIYLLRIQYRDKLYYIKQVIIH